MTLDLFCVDYQFCYDRHDVELQLKYTGGTVTIS